MKILLTCLSLFIAFTLTANTPEQKISSTIRSATVFLSGAQVNRTATANIPAGETIIRFTGLTPHFDPKSIQVKGEGDFIIMGVQHEANYGEKIELGEEVKTIIERIKAITESIDNEGTLLTALAEEEKFLSSNSKIGGSQSGIAINELKAGSEFIRTRTLAIQKEKLAVNRRINLLKEEQTELNKRQNQLAKNFGKYNLEILVTCNAKQAVQGSFKLSYLVKNAGWFPNYDIRVKDVASNVELDYRASVFQSSGENWDKIKLTLSTGNPFESGTKPILNPWRLAFLNYSAGIVSSRNLGNQYYIDGIRAGGFNRIYGVVKDDQGEPLIGANILVRGSSTGTATDYNGNFSLELPPNANSIIVSYIGYQSVETSINKNNMTIIMSDDGVSLDEVVVTRNNITSALGLSKRSKKKRKAATPSVIPNTTVTRTTTVDFVIDLPYTIASTGKQTLVEIKAYQLPATYEYFAIPKLNPDAFLTANVTDWEDYDLLSGEANLFFEGTYLGKSFLNVNAVEDTLALSLGRDKNIVIDRTRKKDFTKKQFIGTNRTELRAWEIDIRNKKRHNVHIIIEDQFPISTDDQIEVRKGNYEKAKLDEDTGKLTWELDIPAASNKKLAFDYEVKYPKKKRLLLE